MRKTYETKSDYDEDYRYSWGPISVPLPAAVLTFIGQRTFTVDPIWTRPLVGGHITIEGVKGYNLGVGDVSPLGVSHPSRIETILADSINLESGDFPLGPVTIPEGKATYYVPRMRLVGTHPAMMRKVWAPACEKILVLLRTLPRPLTRGQSIAVVGCGFGYEVEAINDLGFSCFGIETSEYVDLNKNVSYESEYRSVLINHGIDPDFGEGLFILSDWNSKLRTLSAIFNEDISTEDGRASIRGIIPGGPDWVISSAVLSILDDSEAVALDASMRLISSNVVHYTNTSGNRIDFNWKTLQEWKSLLPNSYIISGGFDIL